MKGQHVNALDLFHRVNYAFSCDKSMTQLAADLMNISCCRHRLFTYAHKIMDEKSIMCYNAPFLCIYYFIKYKNLLFKVSEKSFALG